MSKGRFVKEFVRCIVCTEQVVTATSRVVRIVKPVGMYDQGAEGFVCERGYCQRQADRYDERYGKPADVDVQRARDESDAPSPNRPLSW